MTLDEDAVTIPEALAPAGYISAHIGKWHMPLLTAIVRLKTMRFHNLHNDRPDISMADKQRHPSLQIHTLQCEDKL